ncbi:MAG TPA: AMP-binding protein, partial [Micromonosporaceae bacterium]|nr:AMP-binding protein [Micromonosporaceae bacterium]
MNGWVPDLEGPLIPYPQHILDLLEPRLATDAVAVLDREAALTYRQLGAASAGIAAALRGRGVATGEAVIVHARNSRWAVVGMLGVLRAGARYVPVDAAFPIQRQQHLAAASGARIAVVEPDLPMPLGRFDTVTVDGRHPVGATTRGPLAYTCYTSGSTGLPKGVTISAAALAYSTAARLAYYPRPVTTFLLSSSISFDSSVAGIYWTLASGGTLVIPSDRTTDLVALGRAAHRHAASHLLMVPSLYGIALRGGLAGQLRSL